MSVRHDDCRWGDSLAFIVGCGLNDSYISIATTVAATIRLSVP